MKRARWLIRLRWLAVILTCAGAYLTHSVWHIIQTDAALYTIALLLVAENGACLLSLRWIAGSQCCNPALWTRRLIHFQISADLVLLTVLLHYTGGVENPLIVCFVFHMVIASILLSKRESYRQAVLAVGLLSTMGVLEHHGIIAHYCLDGLLTSGFHADGYYVLATLGVLVATLFLVVYMTTDISSQLRLQESALRRANAALEQKDRIKDEYVARVTHDIKGHLAAVQSCHDVVIRELLGPLTVGQRDFLERAYARTGLLNRFIRTLLRLTEVRLSNHMEMSTFLLNDTVDQAVSACESRARDKSVSVTSRLGVDKLHVYGNAFSIEEVITNLLLNSIKYTPAGGKVDIMARRAEETVCVEVCDTGIGIPAEALPQVFHEFFRAANAKRMEKDGTGLGLSIVKQVIERHHGHICVESREGEGSTFRFTLPVGDPAADEAILGLDPEIEEVAPPIKDRTPSEIL